MKLSVDVHHYRVQEAIYTLDIHIKLTRTMKYKILEFICGYGSNTNKSRILNESIIHLNELKDKKQIKDYILGKDIDIFNINYQNFKYKEILIKANVKNNKGVIYIIV